MMRKGDQVNEILVLFNIEVLKYHYVFRYSSWIEGEMKLEDREGYLSLMVDDASTPTRSEVRFRDPNPLDDFKKMLRPSS